MEWNIPKITGPEATGWNVDRLVTVEVKTGGRPGRCIIFPLYEAAVETVGNRPISLVAAEKLVERVKPGDTVVLMTGMGAMPFMPRGETDGPPGVASLARAVSYGLKALPIVLVPPRDFDAACGAVRAAGLGILDYAEAKATTTRCAVVMRFTQTGDEAKKAAAEIMDKYSPKAVAAVEMFGPNKRGVKHFGAGLPVEGSGEKFPGVEHIFHEASARGVLTIGCLDVGNEMGAGAIEETVRKCVPFADVCRCPCEAGFACAVKVDVTFPASVSNWAAYAITAMVGYLLQRPDILQDIHMERRMLEAAAMAGSIDGILGAPVPAADGMYFETHQCFVRILRNIVDSALSGHGIAGQLEKK
jgi:D-glutamate cyclase